MKTNQPKTYKMIRKLFLSTLLLLSLNFYAQIGFEEKTIVDNSYNSNGLSSVTYSDIDNDGDQDIIAISRNYSGSPYNPTKVGWYENLDGKGNFGRQRLMIDFPQDPKSIYSADIDGDNDQDILVASYNDNSLIWYENLDSKGNFSGSKLISNEILGSNYVRSGDLDGDGDLDLISAASIADSIFWLENLDGNGNFSSKKLVASNVDAIKSVEIGDIDNDGNLDILATSSKDDKIAWHKNDGNGNFSEKLIDSSYDGPWKSILGDIDGDGDIDVISIISNEGAVVIYKNIDGMGNFDSGNLIDNAVQYPEEASLADLDNDGDLDLLYSKYWRENIDGSNFEISKIIGNNFSKVKGVFAADIDGDNLLEVILGDISGKISWYDNLDVDNNLGDQNIITESLITPDLVFAIDIDGDNDDDILATSNSYNQISWYENIDGKGNYGRQKNITIDDRFYTIFPADIDNDNDIDILFGGLEYLGWYENIDGKGNFGNAPKFITTKKLPGENWASSIYGADIDGDNDIDLIYGSQNQDKIAWFENIDGKGTLAEEKLIGEKIKVVTSISLADLDKDGDLDLTAASWSDNKIVWFENIDGKGDFSDEKLVSNQTNRPTSVFASDIDRDGDIDIFSTSLIDSKLALYKNLDGNGAFGDQELIDKDGLSSNVKTIDIDKDGDLDLFCSILNQSTNESRISWFENTNGDGIFGPELIIETSFNKVNNYNFGDFDNDGNIDLIIANSYDGLSSFTNSSFTSNEINGILSYSSNNNDCFKDKLPLSNLFVRTVKNGNETFGTTSLKNGFFQFFLDEGTYETTLVNLPEYFTFSPNSQTSNFIGIGNEDTLDFCITYKEIVNDLAISIYPLSEARAGFSAKYQLVFSNNGTTILNGNLDFNYEENNLDFLNSSQDTLSQEQGKLSFSYENLKPFETRTIDLTFHIKRPPTVEINDILNFSASISPVIDDYTELDNSFTFDQIVIGSFDPNDIRVLEGNRITLNESKNYLHYIIRFENTGNADAINVRVENILDENLNLNTFKLESTSHNSRLEIIDNQKMVFNFDNIYLPDSTTNKKGSQGYIAYKIKPKDGIDIGEIIPNEADIYFDFNLPIKTNTVNTEIYESSLSVNHDSILGLSIYPNPTNSILNIQTESEITDIKIFNSIGQLIQKTSTDSDNKQVDISNLSPGIYYLKIEDQFNRTSSRKIFKN